MRRTTEISAGLLAFRPRNGIEVLLAHPGGPFWAKKDDAAWTIPKGLAEPGDDLLATARREFTEETNLYPHGEFLALAPVKQKSGKVVHAWAFEADFDLTSLPATPSRSSGRRSRAGASAFPRSTASPTSRCRPPWTKFSLSAPAAARTRIAPGLRRPQVTSAALADSRLHLRQYPRFAPRRVPPFAPRRQRHEFRHILRATGPTSIA